MLKWIILVLSSAFETGWAAGLKYASTPMEWVLTIICIVGSSIFLVYATKLLPSSIAYISFVVLGSVGAYLMDIIVFDKNINIFSVCSIAVMLFCIVQLHRCK